MRGVEENRPLVPCHICGREIAVREEVDWATVDVRTRVSLSPPDSVPQHFVAHRDCLKKKPLLADTDP